MSNMSSARQSRQERSDECKYLFSYHIECTVANVWCNSARGLSRKSNNQVLGQRLKVQSHKGLVENRVLHVVDADAERWSQMRIAD